MLPRAASSEFYVINPSTGECPSGEDVSESACEALDGLIVEGITATYQSAGSWDHDTCGCYFNDQSGNVFFNRYGSGCTADDNEMAICTTGGKLKVDSNHCHPGHPSTP